MLESVGPKEETTKGLMMEIDEEGPRW